MQAVLFACLCTCLVWHTALSPRLLGLNTMAVQESSHEPHCMQSDCMCHRAGHTTTPLSPLAEVSALPALLMPVGEPISSGLHLVIFFFGP